MGDTEVVVEETSDTPPADDAPDVVVVDTGDDSGSDNDLEIGVALGALTAEVATLSGVVNNLSERMDMAEANAAAAFDMAITAESTAIDAVVTAEQAEEEAEETSEEVDEIIEPDREHRLWRSPVRVRKHDHD